MSSERSYRVVVLALLAAACGQDLPVPFPTAVTPSMGFTGNLVPIEIFGTGFEPRLIQPASGGTPTLDATFVVPQP